MGDKRVSIACQQLATGSLGSCRRKCGFKLLEKLRDPFAHALATHHGPEAFESLLIEKRHWLFRQVHRLFGGVHPGEPLAQFSQKNVSRFYIPESEAHNYKGVTAVLKGGHISQRWLKVCEETVELAEENMETILSGKNVELCDVCQRLEKRQKKKGKSKSEKKSGL